MEGVIGEGENEVGVVECEISGLEKEKGEVVKKIGEGRVEEGGGYGEEYKWKGRGMEEVKREVGEWEEKEKE